MENDKAVPGINFTIMTDYTAPYIREAETYGGTKPRPRPHEPHHEPLMSPGTCFIGCTITDTFDDPILWLEGVGAVCRKHYKQIKSMKLQLKNLLEWRDSLREARTLARTSYADAVAKGVYSAEAEEAKRRQMDIALSLATLEHTIDSIAKEMAVEITD